MPSLINVAVRVHQEGKFTHDPYSCFSFFKLFVSKQGNVYILIYSTTEMRVIKSEEILYRGY